MSDRHRDKPRTARVGRTGRRLSVSRTATVTAAGAAAALFLGGCTAPAGLGGGASGAAPSPLPLSADAYAATVRAALDPLGAAIGALGRVTEHGKLATGVTAALAADERAIGALQRVSPPTGLKPEHGSLVSALRAVRDDLETLGSDVGTKSVCTGAAAGNGLGRRGSAAALRTAAGALAAKLPDGHITWAVPAAAQADPPRPANGFFPRPGDRRGLSMLKIDNTGTTADTVVTLVKDGAPAFAVYVRTGQQYTVTKVNDGDYELFFTSGSAWDGTARAFGRDCSFFRFVQRVHFRTIHSFETVGGAWQITLHRDPTGNAPTEDADADTFPA